MAAAAARLAAHARAPGGRGRVAPAQGARLHEEAGVNLLLALALVARRHDFAGPGDPRVRVHLAGRALLWFGAIFAYGFIALWVNRLAADQPFTLPFALRETGESLIDQGRSVAYLTGTRQLAERVQDEATELGLEVVRFAARDYGGAKLDDYHQAQAVGVMNYWVYFNSKPVPQPLNLVIFDDAHLAEQPLSGLQTLRIPDKLGPARKLYRTICDLVVAHTDLYAGLQAMRDGVARLGPRPSCCPSATGPQSPRPLVTRSMRHRWSRTSRLRARPTRSRRRSRSSGTRSSGSGRRSVSTSPSAGSLSGRRGSRSARTTRPQR